MIHEHILRRAGSLLIVTGALFAPPLAASAAVEGAASDGSAAPAPLAGPLKVFVLAGQSNMQGHAQVRTLGALAHDPVTAPILEQLVEDDGTPRVCDQVWISSIGSSDEEMTGRLTVGFGASAGGPKIGPELTFGVTMQRLLGEPILIIKTAWGGKSLHTDFRPPSAGPYVFNKDELAHFEASGKDVNAMRAEKAEATGHYYRLMIEHVEHVLADIERVYPGFDASQGHELAGFVWFQGWNDMVDGGTYPRRAEPGGYDAYSEVLTHFIRDVRKDLDAPALPFVIGVMGVEGPTALYGPDQQRYRSTHQNFRDAMAAPASLPEFEGSVSAVLTERFWDLEVTALRKREQGLQPELKRIEERRKSGEIDREQAEAERAAVRSKEFTEEELEHLDGSVSNAAYHYLGSAKILTQIGKAFAEAMHETLSATDR